MKFKLLAIFVGAGFLSCSPVQNAFQLASLSFSEWSLPEASKDVQLDAETRSALATLMGASDFTSEKFGLEVSSSHLKYQTQDRPAQAWKVTVVKNHKLANPEVTWFVEKSEAEAFVETRKGVGVSQSLEPQDSLVGLGTKTTGMLASQLKLPFPEQLEWVNRQLFLLAGYSESQSRFLAEKATLEFLIQSLTPASPTVGQYMSEKRDDRMFVGLFLDYKSRFENVYGHEPLEPDWQKTLTFLSTTWLQNFRFEYKNRFLTNKYLWFGTAELSDAEMAAWSDPMPEYARWEAQFQKNPGDFQGFARWLKDQE